MRIIGGTWRGKKLADLQGEQTRPTSDRAREALFNLLDNHLRRTEKSWQDIVFADVFAGTGAVGVEALSRGAKHVFFFENNPLALKCLKNNTKNILNLTIMGDALKPIKSQAVDIIFMDPPYAKGLWERALPIFIQNGWIDTNTLVIIETDKSEKAIIPQGFTETDRRSYGRNTFMFLMLSQD
ncbi:MAG: 16S rRNA (guanine(966)-N(2))-methyltransferase RsmD [Alphaproteobacteria bacterium]|nr:16S rRNA (guanine(966)-N(2))-methyltransferase RsmD [Alphaproteobacteria bacterium]